MASDSWWRFYNTALDHPKIVLLSDMQFRAWASLNSLASKMGGEFPCDFNLIALTLRKPEGKAREILQVLVSAKLMDCTETGYRPHNWDEKQFKSDVSTERVKRFRERQRNTVSETPHRQRQSTEKETKEVLRNFVVGKGGEKPPITDENKLALFQKWLATTIGKDGWRIVGVAADPMADGYAEAVKFCREHAKRNGKGWPHQWPTPEFHQ